MSQYEFDAERFCLVRSRAARAQRNFSDEQNFLRVAEEVKRLREEVSTLKDAAVHIHNSGYNAGHHYTVEGGYVDIHSSDMDTYHAEEVAELLAALVGEER